MKCGKFIGLMSAVVLMTACERSPTLPENDARMQFLLQHQPQLKNLREEVAAQVFICNKNISSLKSLKRSFSQDESKLVVDSKINAIREQKQLLWQQLNRIDSEAEKGIAITTFNTIEGGNTRSKAIDSIVSDAKRQVETTKRVNNFLNTNYETGVRLDPIPKAIPVPVDPPPQVKVYEKPICVLGYLYYNEIPDCEWSLLTRTFDRYPALFDLNCRQGQLFIKTIRAYRRDDPNFFKNKRWIVELATYIMTS